MKYVYTQNTSQGSPSSGHCAAPDHRSHCEDMETLMKLLGNPETAALLKALAKAMDN